MKLAVAILLAVLPALAQVNITQPAYVAAYLAPPASGGSVSNFPSGPAWLQHDTFSQTYGQATLNNGVIVLQLGEKTQGGNAVVLSILGGNNSLNLGLGFAEVGGQKWTPMVTNNHSGVTETMQMWIATNVPVGCRLVYVTNKSGGTMQYSSFALTEICNINPDHPIDVVSGTNYYGAVISCPGITPSRSGNFLIQYTSSDSNVVNGVSYIAATNQANFDQHWLSTDLADFNSVQCGVYSSTTKFQPTVVNDRAWSQMSVCALLNATNNQGNWRPFGRPYVVAVHHFSQASIGNSFSAPETSLTNIIQMPVYGNLVVISGMGAKSMYTTQTLSQAGMDFRLDPLSLGTNHFSTNSEVSQFRFATNASPQFSNAVSITNFWVNTTNGAVGADATLIAYDIVQADGFIYDTGSTNVGDQLANTGVGKLAQPGPITPLYYGIGFAQENHEFNTATNLAVGTPAAAGLEMLFDSSNCDQWNNDGPMNPDQNGGWAHFIPTNNAAIYFNWQFKSNNLTGVLRSYAAACAYFRGSTLLPLPPLCTPGISGIGVTNTTTGATTYTIVSTNNPPPNSLLLCFVHNSKATTPEVPTLAGKGVEWKLIGTTNVGAGLQRLSIFRSMTNDTPQAGNITASFAGATQTGCNMWAAYVTNVDLSGTLGSGAVQQVVQVTNNTANPVITLAALQGSTNAVVAGFANDVNGYGATSIDAGWTQFVQNGYTTPASGQLGIYAMGTSDNTVSITDGAQVWMGIAIEIKKACP